MTDTFFSDARMALAGKRPESLSLFAPSDKTGVKGSEAGTAGGTSGDAATATSVAGWSKRISSDTLQDEVKALSPTLAESVKTQQGFLGGGNKKARQSLSVLAALFAIANEYDADVKWKNQAAAARSLFAKGGFNCKAATEQTFREAKACNDDLQAMLRGETITAPQGLEFKTDWEKVSNLSPLMNRLELAQRDRISATMASAGEFKKNSPQLTHESEMVAALAEVISQPGMENAEDEKFRGYAQTLQQSALDIRQAVSNGNYEGARAAAGTMAKTCAACHGDFR